MRMFCFTYWTGKNVRRVLLVWVARSREEADETFEEMHGEHPDTVQGLTVEVKRVS